MIDTILDKRKIGVVGPCACGKSTLIQGLAKHGYHGKHIVQEHSYVQGMWKIISNPDVLIFLDVTYEESMRRRKMNWSLSEYEEEQNRLQNARKNADLYVQTDGVAPQEVLQRVLNFLNSTG